MPNVYVINDMHHNFDEAEKFGEIVYVTQGKVPIFKTDAAKHMLREGLKGFDIEEDYLLLSGPAILGIMAAFIVAKDNIPIKLLVFDAKIQSYIVRHLSN